MSICSTNQPQASHHRKRKLGLGELPMANLAENSPKLSVACSVNLAGKQCVTKLLHRQVWNWSHFVVILMSNFSIELNMTLKCLALCVLFLWQEAEMDSLNN
jgi:hypothetical protein